MQGTEGKHLSEPQKVHVTGEFVIVAKSGGHTMSCLASSLVTSRLAGRPKIGLANLKNNSILWHTYGFCKLNAICDSRYTKTLL